MNRLVRAPVNFQLNYDEPPGSSTMVLVRGSLVTTVPFTSHATDFDFSEIKTFINMVTVMLVTY